MTRPSLINSTEQNFSCHACGLCCTRPWKVKVAADRGLAIRQTNSFRDLEKTGFVPLKIVQGGHEVGRHASGSCGFYQNSGCAIHAEVGPETKPTACQLYPFSLVNSPDGHYVSLSFSCPSVLRSDGDSVASQLGRIEETMTHSSSCDLTFMKADSQVAITQEKQIGWDQYKVVESFLIEKLSMDQPTKNLLQTAAILYDWDPESKAEPGAFKPETMQRVAENFPFMSACAVAKLEGYGKDQERQAFSEALLDGEPVYSHRLGVTLPEFDILDPSSEREQSIVHRFLLNQILGKQLISKGTMVSGLLRLATSIAVLFYYMKAREKAEPYEHGDLAWCFRLVETRLIGHSEGMEELFQAYEAMMDEDPSTDLSKE